MVVMDCRPLLLSPVPVHPKRNFKGAKALAGFSLLLPLIVTLLNPAEAAMPCSPIKLVIRSFPSILIVCGGHRRLLKDSMLTRDVNWIVKPRKICRREVRPGTFPIWSGRALPWTVKDPANCRVVKVLGATAVGTSVFWSLTFSAATDAKKGVTGCVV
jgi:hypothetical protein